MVFNATFNNTSDILWQSVLLMEETGKPEVIGVRECSTALFSLVMHSHYQILLWLIR
jgi:hypothetical protein